MIELKGGHALLKEVEDSEMKILFRVWDKHLKEMYYPREKTYMLGKSKSETLEYMLDTGLEDINSHKIWEGDIVKVKAPFLPKDIYPDNTLIGVIIYKPGKFLYKTKTGETYIPDAFETHGRHDTVEVIGNIWENPELFKDD